MFRFLLLATALLVVASEFMAAGLVIPAAPFHALQEMTIQREFIGNKTGRIDNVVDVLWKAWNHAALTVHGYDDKAAGGKQP